MRWRVDRFDRRGGSGYVIPSDRSSSPEIIIGARGKPPQRIVCNELRAPLRSKGKHETGQCGFELSREMMRELLESDLVAILEASTGVMLYRYSPSVTFVPRRAYLNKLPLADDLGLERFLCNIFQLYFKQVHAQEQETLNHIFRLDYTDSNFACGLLSYSELEFLCALRKTMSMMVLAPPRETLARHLVWLAKRGNGSGETEGQVSPHVAQAAKKLRKISLSDEEEVEQWLGSIDEASRNLLTSPITRILANVQPADRLTREHLITAMKNLGRINIVGSTNHPAAMAGAIAHHLDLAFGNVAPSLKSTPFDGPQELLSMKCLAELVKFDQVLIDIVDLAMAEIGLDPERADDRLRQILQPESSAA